jgi:SAM-dependent methyltransferase
MRLTRLRRAWAKGPRAAAAVLIDRVRDACEDCARGMWTGGLIPIETLVPDWHGFHDYAPTSFRAFRALMSAVPIEAGRDVFVDIGCGKGRVLILAAQYPFRRVIGVEIARPLALAAVRHVAGMRRTVCTNVTVWNGRASQFPIPGDATVLYLFNPFHGRELTEVLQRVRRSLEASPRRLHLIVNNPVHLWKELHAFPWLRPCREFSFEHVCVIYEAIL